MLYGLIQVPTAHCSNFCAYQKKIGEVQMRNVHRKLLVNPLTELVFLKSIPKEARVFKSMQKYKKSRWKINCTKVCKTCDCNHKYASVFKSTLKYTKFAKVTKVFQSTLKYPPDY